MTKGTRIKSTKCLEVAMIVIGLEAIGVETCNLKQETHVGPLYVSCHSGDLFS